MLLIDLDSQASLTKGLEFTDRNTLKITLPNLVEQELNKRKGPVSTIYNEEEYIKTILAPLKNKYDYILIDCLPSLGMFLVKALTINGYVLLPVQEEYFSADSVGAIFQSISTAQAYTNSELKVAGAFNNA